MGLSIEGDEAGRLATELAALTGEPVTVAVVAALKERLERAQRHKAAAKVATDLLAIGSAFSKLPDRDVRGADEILGYDDFGVPQ